MTTMIQPRQRFTAVINVMVTEDLRAWVQEQAEAGGVSMAEAVRFYLEQVREKQQKEQESPAE